MPREFEKIRCQRCRAANPLGQELCDQCGTRLMLVVEPSSLRFEEDHQAGAEAGGMLAERVSVLENNLTRFAEKLERTLDLMLKQVQSAHVDHLLLDTLITVLTEARAVDGAELAKRWRAVMEREGFGKAGQARASAARERIVAAYAGDEGGRAEFVKLVDAGFRHMAAGEIGKGIKSLERAAAGTQRNFPLFLFIAEHFFRAGKSQLAFNYFKATFTMGGAQDLRVHLLVAVTIADLGENLPWAKSMLGGVVADEGAVSFAAHYSLGRLAAAEGDWPAAAAAFRRALTARASPEAHYVLALAQYQLGRDRLALRHAAKALELDENYRQSYRLLGLTKRRLGDAAGARAAERRAAALLRAEDGRKAKPGGKGARKAARRPSRGARAADELLLHDFFGASRETGKGLLTGGDARLAEFLRADALAFEPPAR